MKEFQPKACIFEGPQGSGKTTAAEFLAESGWQQIRGIPHAEILRENEEPENWKEALLITSSNINNYERLAMDRSIFSLAAYNAKLYPKHQKLFFNLAASMFIRRTKNSDYLLVFLTSSPEECLEREKDKQSPASLKDRQEVQKEIMVYQDLLGQLRQSGFNVIEINNSGVSKDEFVQKLEEKLAI